jgi:hypothetical protein
VPPAWNKLKAENNKRGFADNCESDDDFFAATQGDVDAYVKDLDDANKDMVEGRRGKKLASPLEDYSHVDPDQLSDDDIAELREPDGKPLKGRERLVKKLETLAGSQSPGMARLEVVFQWILASFQRLCARLNQTLDRGSEQEYAQLREEYIERLRDLDDHEPQRKKDINDDKEDGIDDLIMPGKRGYGRIVKWVHVAPTILNGRIVELRVIVHWNPHSSSSGKPILHG